MRIGPWRATCIQMNSELSVRAPDRGAAWTAIRLNMQRGMHLIERACETQPDVRLFVTPEFGFQGAPLDCPVAEWIEKSCCTIPGPITQPLQQLARDRKVYIAGNQFESPSEWPGRYFNTSFVIAPTGEIVLRYRRITTAAFPSPHDFMDEYLRRTPPREVFPVADTELGRLAMIPCSEISVPEVARVLMMQGAEVILHPTNSRKSLAEDAAKIARSAENKMYLISANVAGPIGFSEDRRELGGHSRIIDHEGRVLAFDRGTEESFSTSALIDIDSLRRDRREDEGPSGLLRARWEMYAPWFSQASFYPPNGFLREPMARVSDTQVLLESARAKLISAGIALS